MEVSARIWRQSKVPDRIQPLDMSKDGSGRRRSPAAFATRQAYCMGLPSHAAPVVGRAWRTAHHSFLR